MASAVGGFDTLVVGAGFAGAVAAERLADQCGHQVCVIDRRDHVGGLAHDHVDDHGVLVHRFGPHIFHTQSAKVLAYLSRFTEWRPYEHRVLADVDGQLVPIPINRDTLRLLYGVALADDEETRAFLAERAEPRPRLETSEDVVVARVGRDLYEKLVRGYTRKQWQLDPSELDASVCARMPVRLDRDDRYFTDAYQFMPADGYTALFERMLAHPRIELLLSTDFEDVRDELDYAHVVYTGPIDGYYDRRFGPLPYRSLRFELANRPTPDGGLVLPTASVNYPSEDVPHTRVTEYRHLTGQSHGSSTLAYEFPAGDGEPYYPVPTPESHRLCARYTRLAAADPGVTFIGRLARYQYMNMDQVTAQALATVERLRRTGTVPNLAVA
ncbi:MAG: UDP-galactopyranose mutase [Actinomycetota bacterium]|nr:UDP-galactopyranose mutase [Actinomycetota bacterium]